MNYRAITALLVLAVVVGGKLKGTVPGVQFRILPSNEHSLNTKEVVLIPLLPVSFRATYLQGKRLDPQLHETRKCSLDEKWLPGIFKVPSELGGDKEGRVAVMVVNCGGSVYAIGGVEFSR